MIVACRIFLKDELAILRIILCICDFPVCLKLESLQVFFSSSFEYKKYNTDKEGITENHIFNENNDKKNGDDCVLGIVLSDNSIFLYNKTASNNESQNQALKYSEQMILKYLE